MLTMNMAERKMRLFGQIVRKTHLNTIDTYLVNYSKSRQLVTCRVQERDVKVGGGACGKEAVLQRHCPRIKKRLDTAEHGGCISSRERSGTMA